MLCENNVAKLINISIMHSYFAEPHARSDRTAVFCLTCCGVLSHVLLCFVLRVVVFCLTIVVVAFSKR